jgi:short-subunit dehydrogenase
MTYNYSAQTVLITGASAGIGREFAVALARRRAALVLVARRRNRLEELAALLRDEYAVAVHVIEDDLSIPEPGPRLLSVLRERGVSVTSLVNNAGFGTFGLFVEEALVRVMEEVAVDVAAPVSLSSSFLPDLQKAGNGFLINVTSMAAYTPAPRMAVYAASKAFLLSFTEALWAENRHTGLTVFALSPGATSTEFNSVVGTEDATAGARKRAPSDVVATALTHLERTNPGPSVIDGASNRIAAGLARFLTRRASVSMMGRLTDPSRRR